MATEEESSKLPHRRTQQSGEENGGSRARRAIGHQIEEVHWKGPIPPPSVLGDYNKEVEEGAERLFRQFELEGQHRRDMEQRKLEAQIFDLRLGKIFTLIFVIGILGVIFYAVRLGHTGVAALLGAGVIGSIVVSFLRVTGDGGQQGDRKKKKT